MILLALDLVGNPMVYGVILSVIVGSAELEDVNMALKRLAKPPDNYKQDSCQRAAYKGEQQLAPLLKPNTTRYGCNKTKSISAKSAC